jgi:hypothetical protein
MTEVAGPLRCGYCGRLVPERLLTRLIIDWGDDHHPPLTVQYRHRDCLEGLERALIVVFEPASYEEKKLK